MNLVGKTPEQVAHAVRHLKRDELVRELASLAALEPFFSPAEIAARRGLSKRKVVELMKTGVIRAHKPLENGWRAPLSAVRDWDEQTAVAPAKSQVRVEDDLSTVVIMSDQSYPPAPRRIR